MVRGVIEAYWALVVARVEVWARQQQVSESTWAYERERERLQRGFASLGDREQARAAMESFRANLIGAEAVVLQREATLRNLMGLPPSDGVQMVPVTPFSTGALESDWGELVGLAEEQRPDLVELKLVLEADQQRILMARNQAQARLDATALYRWNGLEGRTPDRTLLRSEPGAFGEWELGVNFSVPLGLRQNRAQLRQAELVLMQDRANLDQALLNASHQLAGNLRTLAQAFAQYQAFGKARQASWDNLMQQREAVLVGQPGRGRDTAYLDFLQAITSWGNAVNGQAQSLGQYNIELANLERQTGTILETHGVRFLEERYCSIGPLGRFGPERPYPMDSRPGPNENRYPAGTGPSERSLELNPPPPPRRPPPVGAKTQGASPNSEWHSQ
jgi:outer membrane protein TolC